MQQKDDHKLNFITQKFEQKLKIITLFKKKKLDLSFVALCDHLISIKINVQKSTQIKTATY